MVLKTKKRWNIIQITCKLIICKNEINLYIKIFEYFTSLGLIFTFIYVLNVYKLAKWIEKNM